MLFLGNFGLAVALIIWTAKMRTKFKETPTEVHKKALAKGYADLKIMAEHEKRKLAVKSWSEQKTDREIASGIVIDPGGTCLCRRCGQCNNQLDWS